ncbi:hypothetical protein KGF54_003791 [Candida jiufengensis]|uniref:uncharacterized protein n=1 Tax=Candida jiufengensis TaxID=497108 RepID=UPI002225A0F0|nr:uncharacterized protein KGF54_003791 [Candida jiufengensis]KAI5950717.1 hypothetical protein KGF54_003791 [Candida jiufengensis]
MSRHPFHKRLIKEFKEISTNRLPGIKLISNDDNLTNFTFQMNIKDNPIYSEDENYYLSIKITSDYPIDSPSVKFIKLKPTDKIVLHNHVYSNGHLCISILGEDWTPACTIESILLSIQSMLQRNTTKERPPDDTQYIKHAPIDPKDSNFIYHDDNV